MSDRVLAENRSKPKWGKLRSLKKRGRLFTKSEQSLRKPVRTVTWDSSQEELLSVPYLKGQREEAVTRFLSFNKYLLNTYYASWEV